MPTPRFNKHEINVLRKAKTCVEPIGDKLHTRKIYGKEGRLELVKKYNETLNEMAKVREFKTYLVNKIREYKREGNINKLYIVKEQLNEVLIADILKRAMESEKGSNKKILSPDCAGDMLSLVLQEVNTVEIEALDDIHKIKNVTPSLRQELNLEIKSKKLKAIEGILKELKECNNDPKKINEFMEKKRKQLAN